MTDLGERFKAIRKHLGLNATEMGLRVGLGGRSSWERYERGRHIPNGEILLHLAELGIDTNWVLTGQGGMSRGDSAPPSPPAGAVDPALLSRVFAGVTEVYRSENARVSPAIVADDVGRIYNDLVAIYDTPDKRLVGLEMALHQLRRGLRTAPAAGTASSKQAS